MGNETFYWDGLTGISNFVSRRTLYWQLQHSSGAAMTNTFFPSVQPHGMISDTSVLLKDTNLKVIKEGYM